MSLNTKQAMSESHAGDRPRSGTTARSVLAAGLAAASLVVGLIVPAAAGDRPERADHAHMLVLDVEVIPGTFPPVPASVGGCVDLAANKPVPRNAHHDQLHVGVDGGKCFAKTGNIVIPTAPYVEGGHSVPWADCAEFLAFFNLD